MIKFTDLIIITDLDNTDTNQKYGNGAFVTHDKIFIDSYDDVEGFSKEDRIICPTDYAVMCGARTSKNVFGNKGKMSSNCWLRSAHNENYIQIIDATGEVGSGLPFSINRVIAPALNLNLTKLISSNNQQTDFNFLTDVTVNGTEGFIEAGIYPKSYVGDKLNYELEENFLKGNLKITGVWPGRQKSVICDEYLIENIEYEYNGQKYVRVLTTNSNPDNEYFDGTIAANDGEYRWVKVEPIRWKIMNWNDLPTELNPTGTGTAKTVKLRTEEGIISGFAFYPSKVIQQKYDIMWQNSRIRGFLNGINVNNIRTNGNSICSAPNGSVIHWTNFNFLHLAFRDQNRILELNQIATLNNSNSSKYCNKIGWKGINGKSKINDQKDYII